MIRQKDEIKFLLIEQYVLLEGNRRKTIREGTMRVIYDGLLKANDIEASTYAPVYYPQSR